MTMCARPLVFAAVMAALLTTVAHAQLSQSWQVCEGYLLNPTNEQKIKSCTEIIEPGCSGPEEKFPLRVRTAPRGGRETRTA